MKLQVFACVACHATVFPARYFCPACGGAQWRALDAESGTVAETTVVRHRVASDGGADVWIATVTTDAGPSVIARLDGEATAGDTVSLRVDDQSRLLARREA